MLRSIAALALRCVSKQGPAAVAALVLRDARADVQRVNGDLVRALLRTRADWRFARAEVEQ
jgi:hypothetical protein